MNPFTSPFVPGFAHQQGQGMASQNSRVHSFNSNFATFESHWPLIQPTDSAALDSSGSARVFSSNPFSMEQIPIGSLVHLKEAPKWGVVKISNIPYSITRQEIFQFLGRQSRLITPEKGCAVHIIMERSTAKTMECYAEFETPVDAKETVDRINRFYDTGRAPRLGNRHVDVELSDQNALLKDLFPRTKCVVWKDGIPHVFPNTDPYSTGFMGFFTSEEIIGAIRHAEIPHRSPFCDKCPQRTYESTISTLYKFPWYVPALYTVHDRNQLFELANRHIMSLVARIKRSNTVGLDQRLLLDLLRAGLNCPSFNERQKYTLCINSEEVREILKFPEMGKWFPFDTLVKMPNFSDDLHLYYAHLVSKGTAPDPANSELQNTFPISNTELYSPYGRVWFEWGLIFARNCTWENAVRHEMAILSHLVRSGWVSYNQELSANFNQVPFQLPISVAHTPHRNMAMSPSATDKGQTCTESRDYDTFTPSRRASESTNYSTPMFDPSGDCWNQRLLLYPPTKSRRGFLGHRITQSSPTCLPSSSNY